MYIYIQDDGRVGISDYAPFDLDLDAICDGSMNVIHIVGSIAKVVYADGSETAIKRAKIDTVNPSEVGLESTTSDAARFHMLRAFTN